MTKFNVWGRFASALVCLVLPALVLADGKIFLTPIAVSQATIPDQQALISYADGTETLVIETRFSGQGDRFAWVVPLPSVPKVSAVTKGLFPTLQSLFRPTVLHREELLAVPCSILFLLVVLVLCYPRLWAIVIVLIIAATVLLPSLARSGSLGVFVSPTGVTVHERKIIGDYEVATISSEQPNALVEWLTSNGFSVDESSGAIIGQYVDKGWCFCAVKLQRPEQEGVSAPHPLAFRFHTERAVYPLRLTGTHPGETSIDLYVFGPGRAMPDFPGFTTLQCRKTERLPSSSTIDEWSKADKGSVALINPQLMGLVGGEPIATRLSATISSADMSRDVYIDWQPFEELQQVLYTSTYVRRTVADWAGALLSVAVIVLLLLVRFAGWKVRKAGLLLVISATLLSASAYAVYALWPTTELKPQSGAVVMNRSFHEYVATYSRYEENWPAESLANADAFRVRLRELFQPGEYFDRHFYQLNNFTGLPRQEGDAPGEYQLADLPEGIIYTWYDHEGGQHKVLIESSRPPASAPADQSSRSDVQVRMERTDASL